MPQCRTPSKRHSGRAAEQRQRRRVVSVLCEALPLSIKSAGHSRAPKRFALGWSPLPSAPGDTCALVDAWRRRGWNRGCMGRLRKAEEDLVRVLEVLDPNRLSDYISVSGQDPRVLALANLSWLDMSRYGAAIAAQRALLAAEAAHASPHSMSACYGYVFAAFTLQQAGQWKEARTFAERALTVAAEKGIAYWVAMSHVAIGYDQVVRIGDVAVGRDVVRDGLASYRQTQGELLRPFILSLLAHAEAMLGDVELARMLLSEAAQVADLLEAHGQMPALLLQHAQILDAPEHATERYELLTQGLAAARAQEAEAIVVAIRNEMSLGPVVN